MPWALPRAFAEMHLCGLCTVRYGHSTDSGQQTWRPWPWSGKVSVKPLISLGQGLNEDRTALALGCVCGGGGGWTAADTGILPF